MYYLSNEKKIKFFFCVGPLGAPHDPSGQCRTRCPRADPYGANRTDSVSEMGRPAGDALKDSLAEEDGTYVRTSSWIDRARVEDGTYVRTSSWIDRARVWGMPWPRGQKGPVPSLRHCRRGRRPTRKGIGFRTLPAVRAGLSH
jgi:hypothetical protein